MGTTLHPCNRRAGNLNLNVYSMDILRYLTWGLKKLYGIYPPMSKEDCKIVARILRNKASLLEITMKNNSHTLQDAHNIIFTYGEIKDYLNDPETIQWIRECADWFDKCSGLRDAEGYNEE